MKYFNMLLCLICLISCSKKETNNVSINTNDAIINDTAINDSNAISETANILDEIQNTALAAEILMQYMQKNKFENMNDLMPIQDVKNLSEEQKSNYVSFICFMIDDYCKGYNIETSIILMKEAYDYLRESGLFNCLKPSGKQKISSGMLTTLIQQYQSKKLFGGNWSNVVVDIDIGFELLNNISNYIGAEGFNAAFQYYDYAELYNAKGDIENAKLYYTKMAESSGDDIELYQNAIYYRALVYKERDFEKFEKEILEFLIDADPEYGCYKAAMSDLTFEIYNNKREELLEEFKSQSDYEPNTQDFFEKFREFWEEKINNYITNKLKRKK